MRDVTSWGILIAPIIILLYDLYVWLAYGDGHTITAVVREWADKSSWPEFVYVVGVLILYTHLFRKWPL